ncbi:S-adenosyl-L-methionine-dependent methyltransferase [Lasiosphaeria hispida]|uniref:S-adenosyl-L-methionine-dependent methyltransferase n=1 Tax=Lasiosphaeria hispida TaxID=260671 RepID=A0AAJ0MFK3_9PEZI|nr:S-adenosyl-L-methionine-dependent methyltransferase [Lasiosphaeria hispida]
MAEPGPKSPSKSPTSPSSPVSPPANLGAVVEVDLAVDDGYDTDTSGSVASTSLASGIRDYVFENNRRYHKFREGRYLIPNDEPEQEREDMKHAMVVHICEGRLHFAPLVDPQEVLDIGTGTGIWAIDMADEYPSAEVVGIDLSPIQPTWVPPNVRFLVDDAESEWTHGRNRLDFVHARHVCMAIRNWPRLLERAYESLEPGGWIELQELRLATECDDGSMPVTFGLSKFLSNLREGFSRCGIDLLSLEKNEQRLRDAGFVGVKEKIWKIPIGPWAKDPELKTAGLYNRAVIYDALQGVSLMPYTRGLGWTPTEVEVFLVDVRKSLFDVTVHSYYTFHTVYGQKPLAPT